VRTLRGWIVRLKALASHRRREQEMTDELESHLALHVDHNLQIGMTPDEARRQALLALGGLEQAKEQYRDRAGVPVVEILMRDLRDAWRRLWRFPVPVLTILLTLSVSVGVNGMVFAIADSLILRPFALPDIESLVVVSETRPDGGRSWTSPATFLDWRERSASLRPLVAVMLEDVELGDDNGPERLRAAKVSHGFFTLVGGPARGRGFLEEESALGRHRTVVIGDGLWHRRFGADPAIVGRTMVVDSVPHRVVGVAPPRFGFPYGVDLWLPLAFDADALASRDNRVLFCIGRLADGVSLEHARADMSAIADSIAREFPVTHRARRALVQTLVDGFVEEGVRPVSVLLHVSALLVLFVACGNIANLLVALGAERRREVAVRRALGATRGAIARGVWLEHVSLAVVSVPLALLVAGAALSLARTSMPAQLAVVVPGWDTLDVDGRLVLFTVFVAVVSTGVFGAFSAVLATRDDPDALKEGARGQTSGVNRLRLRRLLVVAQVALVLPLVATAASSWRGTVRLLNGPHGYDPDNVVSVRLTLPERHYPDRQAKQRFVSELLERLGDSRAAHSAAVVNVLPATTFNQTRALDVQGQPPARGEPEHADYRVVSPNYFDTMRIRLLRGRHFTGADQEHAPPVAIVSASMAEKYWPESDPIGRHFRDPSLPDSPWVSIVGIADDILHDWYVGGNAPTIYRPYEQDPVREFALTVRTGDPAAALSLVRAVVHSIDPARPLNDVMPMRDVIEQRLVGPRQVAHIMAALGGLALLLAAMGLYGLVAHNVSQRTHEIGLRVVLGASRRDVLRLVLGQGSRLMLTGMVVGGVLTFGTAGVARAVTFGIAPLEPLIVIALALFIAAIGLLAAYAPARRAISIPPIIALRHE
jgi:putative ABC transport system permease protein